MSEKKYRLAIVATHLIQYAVPLYHKINSHPGIELTVYFCSDQGLGSREDDKYGLKIKWDNIKLSGLNYKFLKNYSPFPAVTEIGLINFGIFKELKENKYDAVFINGYYTISAWLTIIACRLTKTSLILTGEPPSPWKKKIVKIVGFLLRRPLLPLLLNFASAILYLGAKSKEFYYNYGKHIKDFEDKLFFAPYSVDNDFFFKQAEQYRNKKQELKKDLGIPPDFPVILYLSQLVKRKQPLFLLRAFSKIKTKAVLVYVGSGPCDRMLKEYIKRFNIPRVFLAGFKNYGSIPKYYSIADLFVLPSLGESYGLVINEAMCFGLPVITTNRVGAAFDLLEEGQNGYLINPSDENSLVERLDAILSDPEKIKQMSKRSREMISDWNYEQDLKAFWKALNFIDQKINKRQ